MANSDWLRDSKLEAAPPQNPTFKAYVNWYALVENDAQYWRLFRKGDAVDLVYLNRWSAVGLLHRERITSLEEWEASLQRNKCPIPQSLATILNEYRQGRDGKAAVDFYTQSGDVF